MYVLLMGRLLENARLKGDSSAVGGTTSISSSRRRQRGHAGDEDGTEEQGLERARGPHAGSACRSACCLPSRLPTPSAQGWRRSGKAKSCGLNSLSWTVHSAVLPDLYPGLGGRESPEAPASWIPLQF